MKKLALAIAVTAAVWSGSANAAPPAPSPWDVAINSALQNDYIFRGVHSAVGLGFVQNYGHTNYEGTGFSTSGDQPGICIDGYIQKPIWLYPTGLTVNAGGMAAFCTGPKFGAVNPGNGLTHTTKIGDYWLLGGRAAIEQLLTGGYFRSVSLFGEFGAAISDTKIEVPGFEGANTTSTQPFFGIGISGTTPWGMGTTQNVDQAALELYIAYRQFDAKATAQFAVPVPTTTEVRSVLAGARIKF